MSLTEADVRARVDTDLDSKTVTRILNSATKAVDRAAGSAGQQTEVFIHALGALYLPLPRRSESIEEVRERRSPDSDEALLGPAEYRKVGDYRLQRVGTSWGAQVEVDYVPETDTDVRERVILDLCQMDIEFRAISASSEGASTQDQKDYKARRRELLKQVKEGRSPVL